MRLLTGAAEARASTGRLLKGAASLGALTRMTFRSSDPKSPFKGPLVEAKRAAWSEAIALEEVKELATALEAKPNDLLLTAMTGGLRRYLLEKGEEPEGASFRAFRAVVPVSLRPLERMSELGNEFGLIFLSLPVGIADPIARLAALRRRMRSLKRSAEPLVVLKLLQLIGKAPKAIQQAVVSLFATKTTAVMTSVPGPRERLYLAGRPIRSIFFWVPQAGRVGLGVSILSYAGQVRLGVGTDAGLVPDPERIVDGFHQELDELRRLARTGSGG
jgi:WS/DGAT/MGAT family acyltransferase